MTQNFHINPETGRPNKCAASTRSCKYAKDGEMPPHYSSKEEAREAYDKQNSSHEEFLSGATKKPPHKKLEDQRAAAKAEVDAYHAVYKYPSEANPQYKELKENLHKADDEHKRALYDLPKTWESRMGGGGLATWKTPNAKMGPNGAMLRATAQKPITYNEDDGLPDEGLYIETSAGNYISGPYDSPKDLEEAMGNHSGSSLPSSLTWS